MEPRDIAARVYNIPAGISFSDALARGLLERFADQPGGLSTVSLYLPTRRAVRTMREAFLRQSDGRALLLPIMRALGDVDEDEAQLLGQASWLDLPPALSSLRRRLLLAQLVIGRREDMNWAQAVELGTDLARLLDHLHSNNRDLEDLKALELGDLAKHWQHSLTFLNILADPWQDLLRAEGAMDPVRRRNAAVDALIRQWQEDPPKGPVFAAGSTGSLPSTASLLCAIARLPQGAVVLPGLDQELDETSWEELEDSHPQFAMGLLLQQLGLRRQEVSTWPVAEDMDTTALKARRKLLSEAMRPAKTTGYWRQMDPLGEEAISGFKLVQSTGPREEALAVALMMRQALETEGRTAALITADRGLARRVTSELRRWQIDIDDSAGMPLFTTLPGGFLRLVAEAAAQSLAPVPLLALLKHPLCLMGRPPGDQRLLARKLENPHLRGARPEPGFDGLRYALGKEAAKAPLADFLTSLEAVLSPLLDCLAKPDTSLAELLHLHIRAAEELSRDESGEFTLWRDEAGEATANFVHDLNNAAKGLGRMPGHNYPAMLQSLMQGHVVRPRFGGHPRLAILGPLEARLQNADLVIIGGLNEGVWPVRAEADPWLNRPMLRQLQLATPERRIGLAAHDFAQAANAPEVIVTRTVKSEGAQTVPSRWLLRLDQVMGVSGLRPDESLELDVNHWARRQDQPDEVRAIAPPRPTPPLTARPRKLSVTRIENWLKDPYWLYAYQILKLRPLDPLDSEPDAADRGSVIHDSLEEFLKTYPAKLPPDAFEQMRRIGEEKFGTLLRRPLIRAFWWPRFLRLAKWFVEQEEEHRRGASNLAVEISGSCRLKTRLGFEFTAKADRIDELPDGSLIIIDYKTGQVPSAGDVEAGIAPQLPLEAVIAMENGFPDISGRSAGQLTYWRLSGGRTAGEVKELKFSPERVREVAEAAHAGLIRLVNAFDDPATPYRARPRPEISLRFNDYEHLARLQEWSAGGGVGDD